MKKVSIIGTVGVPKKKKGGGNVSMQKSIVI